MKISEFSRKYGVSNDTVRYYMDLNLLLPEKKGGHYYFDEKCEAQLKEILTLKEMDFSLQEIKKIFQFKRIGKLSTFQKNKHYQYIYKNKYRKVEQKIDRLIKARDRLKKKIKVLEKSNKNNETVIGVDLDVLSLFCCPVCGDELLLSAEKVVKNQILKGSLNCKCGESLTIKEGILYTNFEMDQEEELEENHIEKYINEIDPDYIDILYQTLEWHQRQIDFDKLKNKIILEPGSGSGFLLRQIYEELDPGNIYICVDKNPHLNNYLKQLLEATARKARVIFITADLPELPLKENIVDFLIDFTGTSSFSFTSSKFLPGLLDRYISDNAEMTATYIVYHRFGHQNIVAEPYRDNFRYKFIRDNILKLGFELEKECKGKFEKVEKTFGKYEQFAQPGDEVSAYQILARR